MRQHGTFSLSRTTCMRQCALHSSTLEAARRHLGMSVCRRRRSAGLQRVRVCLVCCCSRSSRWSVSCSPVALRVWFVLSCCHAVSDACARPGTAPHHLLAAATREVALVALVFLSVHLSLVALEAWRWRLGAGGLALEASWPVAVRRRPLVVALGAAWRGVAWRGMRRGECRLWVPRA